MSQSSEPAEAERTPIEPEEDTQSSAPRPILMLFAAVFVAAMLFNLAAHGSNAVTIFLGSATMLTLGVDVGKITGRR